MLEVTGNLWTYPADFRVITTNGSIRRDGLAVMGRGCAREATERYPTLQRELGLYLKQHGNRGRFFDKYNLFTFPVKHCWNEWADVGLIERSTVWFTRQLLKSCSYVMPRPGCGNGHLSWDLIRPILEPLPDNVFVITFS